MTELLVYGKANGNGPLHLMVRTPSGSVARCGSKRAHEVGSSAGYWGRAGRICQPCQAAVAREKREQERAEATKGLATLEAECVGIGESLVALRAAQDDLRERVERTKALFLGLRGADLALRDGLMQGARYAGMTLQEIGELFGVTREAVRQRLALLDRTDRP